MSCFGSFGSIDTTKESNRIGKLINHSLLAKDNLTTRIIEVHGQPHLCFLAKKKIEIGDEVLYSCGERRRRILQENPLY